MSDDTDKQAVAAELTALHRQAREAFQRRDLQAYMGLFAPELRYHQPNGKVIGLEQLTRDVARQLRIIRSSEMDYVTESLEVSGDTAVEVVTQTASVVMTGFVVIHPVWNLHRRGRWTWQRRPEGWRITEVDVLEERMTQGGIRFGLRP